MSGFEITGVVLGAFPIAISAVNAGLEKYSALARRLKLFYAFKYEHKRFRDDLMFNQLMFNTNLRRLLLPLVVTDDKIEVLLSNPTGPEWKEHDLDEQLQRRLGGSHALFLNYVVAIKRVILDLNIELTIAGGAAQSPVDKATLSTKERFFAAMSSESREFIMYKVKFSNSEAVRNRLLADMRDYNEKLEKLLSSTAEESRLIQQRAISEQSHRDNAGICDFWKNAVSLSSALQSSSTCDCGAAHSAELLLRHRKSDGADFRIDFIKSECFKWETCKTLITEGNEAITTKLQQTVRLLERTSERDPERKRLNPFASALESSASSTTTQLVQ
ncbi:hypothetical protein FOBRF1_006798 [Fusarium oxysporum]